MSIDLRDTLTRLQDEGNFRSIPEESTGACVDMTSNDYLGLAADEQLRSEFFAKIDPQNVLMSSSASRLLGGRQREYSSFETLLASMYGRSALLFNSGYHANVGIIQAIADKNTLVIADRLVHASIIDGIRLSGAAFCRFAHNDYAHLNRIIDAKASQYSRRILIVAESVYSMDGDRCDLHRLIEAKHRCDAMLYIDEAHAVGVLGPAGLGLCAGEGVVDEIDILIGTLGKALASSGAYAVVSEDMRHYLVNRCRSLIFSTALPPISVAWSEFVFRRMAEMDSHRTQLENLGKCLAAEIGAAYPSHILPVVVGSAARAIELSARLREDGFKVLPIRTPTVPPGTERLRLSLLADLCQTDIVRFGDALRKNLSKMA